MGRVTARGPNRSRRWVEVGAFVVLALIAAACTDDGGGSGDGASDAVDRAYYVLPPGNYGGLPTNDDSLDQLPLYDGLTPLRDDITDADIEEHFLDQDFEPIGETVEEDTGRAGVEILYDDYGVAHVTGETREDMAFGAGWVTARDRGLLLELGRGPAVAAAADIPGIDAFDLVLSGRGFTPSADADALLDDQVDLLIEEYGEEGEEVIADADAYAAGVTAFWEANDVDQPPIRGAEVLAVTAFIGSIFGTGGGSEASNAEVLSILQNDLGDDTGRQAWEDLLLIGDPEAPTTLEETFDYGAITGGDVTGAVAIDEGSIDSYEPAGAADQGAGAGAGTVDAAGPPPDRQASNWLLVDRSASQNDTPLGVLGPQLGYYYPEIVQQIHLRAPGIEAQGAAVPGLSMYLLLGRTEDYAWSLTSASHDVRDVFAEVLCEPDGSAATVASNHYEFEDECRPFETFDAGMLDGESVVFRQSVHGPVIGTATSDSDPVALTRARSTFGRDGLNLVALKRMTEGAAATPEDFYDTANLFEFTFNWGWVGREGIAYFSSGRLPDRAEGLDRRLPTLGTGEYEWDGFLDQDAHPHGEAGPNGRLLNWNNQSAPGFMHGDGTPYGSVHRVEMFDQWPDRVDLAGTVGVMNRAATELSDAQVWPVVSDLLAEGDAPSATAQAVVDYLDGWQADDAPAVDGDDDGDYDEAGPAIIEALLEPLVLAAIEPVVGERSSLVQERLDLDGDTGASILDKDLRTLLDRDVDGPFNLSYCGEGALKQCADDLWAVVETVALDLAGEYGDDDPTTWLSEGALIEFAPGLIDDTMRFTNRPTFQQLLEFVPDGNG